MDVMLDLETMGTSSRSAIVSIGAVAFERAGQMPTDINFSRTNGLGFYCNVNLQSCLDLGLEVSGATIMWWLSRSAEARAVLKTPEPVPVQQAVAQFSQWCARQLTSRTGCVWSHGADFDVKIMSEIMDKLKIKPPWQFWNVEHTRTLYNEAGIKLPRADDRLGGHNAFYDAALQAEYVQRAIKILRERRGGPELVAALAIEEREESDL